VLKEHAKLIIIGISLIASAAILAAQFRYETHNKPEWGTVVFDRWTGTVRICDETGCMISPLLKSAPPQTNVSTNHLLWEFDSDLKRHRENQSAGK